MEACLGEKGHREGRVYVASRERFVLGEGAYGSSREFDMCEPGAECVIKVSFVGDGLEFVDVSSDFIFSYV